ncbi:hypothetical protein OL67_001864 [Phaeobacter piscinae]|nr:hypothetical protein OL67_001864 [Phaeobacter piscinae]
MSQRFREEYREAVSLLCQVSELEDGEQREALLHSLAKSPVLPELIDTILRAIVADHQPELDRLLDRKSGR